MWIHNFKNLMAHKKIWHAMTNIGAINSKHTKPCGVTKNHWLPWKFMTPCGQMTCHIIITWKTKLLLITKDKLYCIIHMLCVWIFYLMFACMWFEAMCLLSMHLVWSCSCIKSFLFKDLRHQLWSYSITSQF